MHTELTCLQKTCIVFIRIEAPGARTKFLKGVTKDQRANLSLDAAIDRKMYNLKK